MKILSILAILLTAAPGIPAQTRTEQRIPVTFSGGHDTDPRDHGRPDVLIAAAMGVPTEVFRDAFSHVTPAAGGLEPDPEQVRRNKEALLRALSPYGLTNDRIDTVSNYYRYNRGRGELLWRSTPATAYATVRDGALIGFTITNAGSGYSSEPLVTVTGMPDLKIVVKLAFSRDFQANGSVAALSAGPAK